MENKIVEYPILVCLGGSKLFPCKNFNDASVKVVEYIEKYRMGSNYFYSKNNAGMIFHRDKGIIACVSYNGRVWESDGSFELKPKEITDLSLSDI